jgi:hypothetical protein
MYHYKPVIVVIVLINNLSNSYLIFNSDVARVNELLKFENFESDLIFVRSNRSNKRVLVQLKLLSLFHVIETRYFSQSQG